MTLIKRAGSIALAGLFGLLVGVAGTVAHASQIGVLPVGLVLSFVAVASALVALRLLAGRAATAVGALGLLVAVVVFSGEGPGGSVIAPADDAMALVWAIGAPLIAVLAVAWPAARTFGGGAASAQVVPAAGEGEAQRP